MNILVFKTDIRNKKQVTEVESHLVGVPGVVKWNVDLHDVDKILRIESETISPRFIEKQLQLAGYYCQELDD